MHLFNILSEFLGPLLFYLLNTKAHGNFALQVFVIILFLLFYCKWCYIVFCRELVLIVFNLQLELFGYQDLNLFNNLIIIHSGVVTTHLLTTFFVNRGYRNQLGIRLFFEIVLDDFVTDLLEFAKCYHIWIFRPSLWKRWPNRFGSWFWGRWTAGEFARAKTSIPTFTVAADSTILWFFGKQIWTLIPAASLNSLHFLCRAAGVLIIETQFLGGHVRGWRHGFQSRFLNLVLDFKAETISRLLETVLGSSWQNSVLWCFLRGLRNLNLFLIFLLLIQHKLEVSCFWGFSFDFNLIFNSWHQISYKIRHILLKTGIKRLILDRGLFVFFPIIGAYFLALVKDYGSSPSIWKFVG